MAVWEGLLLAGLRWGLRFGRKNGPSFVSNYVLRSMTANYRDCELQYADCSLVSVRRQELKDPNKPLRGCVNSYRQTARIRKSR
jgi:hypothetical protein